MKKVTLKRNFFKVDYIIFKEIWWKKISLLTLVILAFFLIASSLFITPTIVFPRKESIELLVAPLPQVTKLTKPHINAAAAIVYDPRSSVVLFEKNADTSLPPASTTKIVTAMVALQNYQLEKTIQVDGAKIDGQKMKLIEGEQISIKNLLDGLLIFSANDAAEVLAGNFSGGREKFVEEMNKIVADLRLSNTHFTNPSGLFEDNHFSTTRDLAKITVYAMRNPVLARVVGTKEKTVTSLDGNIVHKLTNLNALLGNVPGVLGVKTGKTDEGGEALVTFVERDVNPLIIVVLGAVDRFGDTRELIDWAYQNHQWRKPQ